jgi:hypothetical protein
MAVNMKSATFWDVTPCHLVEVHTRFGGTCCLHLQGKTAGLRQATGKQSFLLLAWPIFDVGDVDSAFVPNDGKLIFNSVMSHPNRWCPSNFVIRFIDFNRIVTGRCHSTDGWLPMSYPR